MGSGREFIVGTYVGAGVDCLGRAVGR
jgi:hypothetical protein